MRRRRSRGFLAIGLAATAFIPTGAALPSSASTRSEDDAALAVCARLLERMGVQAFGERFGTPQDCAHVVAGDPAFESCARTSRPGSIAFESCVVRAVLPEAPEDAAAPRGIVYTTASGAGVRVAVTEGLGLDDGEARRWAEFLAGLVHGRELETVTLQLSSAADVRHACGDGIACYLPGTRTIHFAPGGNPAELSAEAVLTHEYGHHVANSRDNAPWDALVHGPKRWATEVRVCERIRSQEFFARGPWGLMYRRNPAEGFAEAYRLLNERRAGAVESAWLIADRRFYPDARALRQLERDVRDPWTRPATIRLSGRGSRTHTVATPLDGTLSVTLHAARGSVYRVAAPRLVCGERRVAVRVTRLRGSGGYTLTVERP